MATATRPIKPSTAVKAHIVSREFNAPRELVWKANTEAERLAQWLSPEGYSVRVKRMDFRVSGEYLSAQLDGDGNVFMWGKVIYQEIRPIERLVYIQSFSDENGGIGAHPLAPLWPRQMLSTVTFEEIDGGRTRMTVEWSPYKATPEEEAFFNTARSGMDEGWKGTFDKLESYMDEVIAPKTSR